MDAKVFAQVLEPVLPVLATKINLEFVERLLLLILLFTIGIMNLNPKGDFEAINALNLLRKFRIVVAHLKLGANNSSLVFTLDFFGFQIDRFCLI